MVQVGPIRRNLETQMGHKDFSTGLELGKMSVEVTLVTCEHKKENLLYYLRFDQGN